jgi:hypothetical protein
MATIDRRGATVSAADPPIGTNPNPDLAIKAPVRAATTGSNITLSGLQTIDGVALVAGDRVLVKDQTNATTNGLYNASTGNWTRTIDANNNSQWTTGTQVYVSAGTVNTGKTYQLMTAIPIVLGVSNLTFALLAIAATAFAIGVVSMFPSQNQGSAAWNVIDPFGNAISTAGTTTQGLQEAINAALNSGWGLVINGFGIQGSNGLQPIFINCTTAITVAAAQIAFVDIRNCTINFTAAVTGDAITFNSLEMAKIAIHAQIVYAGSGYAIRVKPTTGTPLDHNIAASPITMEIHTIAAIGGAAAGCIAFDMTSGPVLNDEFRFVELNGGAVGIDIVNPTHPFEQNIIRTTNIHRQTVAGVRVGSSATNQANLRHNTWLVSSIHPINASAIGFDSWGSNDVIIGLNVTNEEGSFATGVKFESGADFNTVIGGQILAPGGAATIDTDALNTFVRANAVTTGTLQGKAGNSSSNVRAPGMLATQLVSTATGANMNETDLQTFTLPTNLFDAIGRGIRFKMWGTTGADANAKTVRVYFGVGNKIYDSTGVTANNGSWMVMGEIYKIGVNNQASWTTGIFINSWPSTDVQQNSQTESGTIILKVTGQNGAAVANDIVCQGMTIEVLN